jgi:hypothetical protein
LSSPAYDPAKLTPKQKRAARLLARGHTQPVAAARADCSPRTIRNWLRDVPGFREAATDPAEAARDPEVYEVFADLLNDPNPLVRARAVEIALKYPADSFPREHQDAVQVVLHDLRKKRQPDEATA